MQVFLNVLVLCSILSSFVLGQGNPVKTAVPVTPWVIEELKDAPTDFGWKDASGQQIQDLLQILQLESAADGVMKNDAKTVQKVKYLLPVIDRQWKAGKVNRPRQIEALFPLVRLMKDGQNPLKIRVGSVEAGNEALDWKDIPWPVFLALANHDGCGLSSALALFTRFGKGDQKPMLYVAFRYAYLPQWRKLYDEKSGVMRDWGVWNGLLKFKDGEFDVDDALRRDNELRSKNKNFLRDSESAVCGLYERNPFRFACNNLKDGSRHSRDKAVPQAVLDKNVDLWLEGLSFELGGKLPEKPSLMMALRKPSRQSELDEVMVALAEIGDYFLQTRSSKAAPTEEEFVAWAEGLDADVDSVPSTGTESKKGGPRANSFVPDVFDDVSEGEPQDSRRVLVVDKAHPAGSPESRSNMEVHYGKTKNEKASATSQRPDLGWIVYVMVGVMTLFFIVRVFSRNKHHLDRHSVNMSKATPMAPNKPKA